MPRRRKTGKEGQSDALSPAHGPATIVPEEPREAVVAAAAVAAAPQPQPQPQPQPVRYQPPPAPSSAGSAVAARLPFVSRPFNAAAAPYSPAGGDPTQLHQRQQPRALPRYVQIEPRAPVPAAPALALPLHFAPAPEPPVEAFRQLQLQPVEPDSATPPPVSSRALRYPRRPGKGVIGRRCIVKANHFIANLPDKDLHQYDVAIVPEVASRGVNRVVIRELISVYNTDMGNRLPVYDGRKSLYTAGPLPFQHKEFEVKLVDDAESSTMGKAPRERLFKVTIKFAARADLHHLGEFLKGKQADAPQEALQVLDIVLRELPTTRYTPVGRSFYSPHLGRRSLGEGLEAWRGFYQSIRPTQMGLSLNIDMSATAFLEPQPVVLFVENLLGRPLQDRSLTDVERVKIKKALRGIKVEVTHRGTMRRKYRVSGLTTQTTADLRFPVDQDQNMMSVADYFWRTYEYRLKKLNLPCLQVGNQQRPNYLPMEVCKIVEGQRFSKRLNERQITALLSITCQKPYDRESDIRRTVQQNDYDRDKFAQEFGIKISRDLATVEARILPAPWLTYNDSGLEKECQPAVGQWNMVNKKMVNGGKVSHWACVNFSRNISTGVASDFCKRLADMCVTSGMQFSGEPVVKIADPSRPDQVERVLKQVWKTCNTKLPSGKNLDLLIAILPDQNGALYGDLKRICETDLGVVSQCCLTKHVYKMSKQYLANVALKINVKVGGRNTVLRDALAKRLPMIEDTATIIFGADVTHPHPGEDSSPSIAAVVASQDWPEVTQYAGLVSAQAHRQELIQDLYTERTDAQRGGGGMIIDLLKSFYNRTRLKPRRIIFYRDGVSEGQFYQVLLFELNAIRKACATLEEGYQPPVTFVVVQKRHHTRLFPHNYNDKRSMDRSDNILPGTVVDTQICHPTEFDFYLCSHAGIQGTSRPAHYHVLWDENKFSADTLQTLTNNLCYTYARCTRSVSIVPPAYYAHLAAFRARFYLEPDNSDSGSLTSGGGVPGRHASTESGGSRNTTRAGGPSAIRPLPSLKESIKRVMFFC